MNALSIFCYLATAYIATFIPAHYGRDDSKAEAVEPFLASSYDDISSPASTSILFEQSAKKVLDCPRLNYSSQLYQADYPQQQHSVSQLLNSSLRSSYTSLLKLFSVPNPTFTVVILLLIYGIAVRIEVILPQYISLSLGWPLATVNRLQALKALVSAASLFALPTIRKRYLEPHFVTRGGSIAVDLFITQASLTVNTIGIIGLGFSAGAPFFILALCVYTSGNGLLDSLTSYGTFTLPANESVAEFYVRTGLVSTVASLIGGPWWSAALSFVLRSEWMPLGTPFWLCAGLFGLGCAGVVTLRSV